MSILAAPAANSVVPGVLGFLVVAGLALALFFLLRSLNKQLGKVITGPRWREGNGQPGAGAGASRAEQADADRSPDTRNTQH